VLRVLELDARLQVGVSSRVEQRNRIPSLDLLATLVLVDIVGLLGCEWMLSAHVQLFIHYYPQVLLDRAVLNPFIPQPVLIAGVAPNQMQDPALGLVEPHEVHTGPLLGVVQVLLQIFICLFMLIFSPVSCHSK